jgi:co-chaperonin GroES (HSP10)
VQKSKGGILLPDAAKPALNEGIVVAVGNGIRTEASGGPALRGAPSSPH